MSLSPSSHFHFVPRNSGQHLAKHLWDAGTPVLFLLGVSGTGKSHTALGLSLSTGPAPVLFTRPAVTAGEDLGFLPGDLDDKFQPYLDPVRDCLDRLTFVKGGHWKSLFECVPLGFFRGRTVNRILLVEEAQNATFGQLKMLLTRLGPDGRMIFTGDPAQVDVPRSGLARVVERLDGVSGVGLVRFLNSEVVRHPLVREFSRRLS